jgi:hypothetical protein
MTPIRAGLVVLGCLALAFALGFYFELPWALAFWPWPDTSLSYTFVGAIAGAIGAATLWLGVSGELGAISAGAISVVVMLGGIAATLGVYGIQSGDPRLFSEAGFAAVAALGAFGAFLWGRRFAGGDSRPMPVAVRGSFVAFLVVLVLAGGALLLQIPNVLPWRVLPETSVLFGWIFLGDAAFFLYAAVQGRWIAAPGPLLAFLAYDLVLFGPLSLRWATVAPEQQLSLLIYLAVLAYSALLAIFYLFVHRPTRLIASK